MNNSVGLIISAGLCLVSNLINLMAKLRGNRVHDATVTLEKFVTHQRKSTYSWFSNRFTRYISGCLDVNPNS